MGLHRVGHDESDLAAAAAVTQILALLHMGENIFYIYSIFCMLYIFHI